MEIQRSSSDSLGGSVILFRPGTSRPERRELRWLGALPFRPRREADYSWTEQIAQAPQAMTSGAEGFLIASLLLHVGLLPFFHHISFNPSTDRYIEVDLTEPYKSVPSGMEALSRPVRRGTLDGSGHALEQKTPKLTPTVPAENLAAPASPAHAPDQTEGHLAPQPDSAQHGSEHGVGGAEYALISLTALPRLANASELEAILQRYYPEKARQERREGRVLMDLYISEKGEVVRWDIERSGGTDFDEAAKKIAPLLHFSPARVGSKAVAVRLRQNIIFQLKT